MASITTQHSPQGQQSISFIVQSLKAKVDDNLYVLGAPIWLQDDEYSGEFIMQFDEKFADINLGDMGIMYVFRDTAFWQCH